MDKHMKKERLRGFATGFMTACIVLSLIGTASAAVMQKNLLVNYHDISIAVNGSVILPTDVNGTVVEPFIYQGTTYLPVRAVSEALGADVSWDQETYTVYITTDSDTGESYICYGALSLPSYENANHNISYYDYYIEDLISGTGVAFYYSASAMLAADSSYNFDDALTDYADILELFGYTFVGIDTAGEITYYSFASEITNQVVTVHQDGDDVVVSIVT